MKQEKNANPETYSYYTYLLVSRRTWIHANTQKEINENKFYPKTAIFCKPKYVNRIGKFALFYVVIFKHAGKLRDRKFFSSSMYVRNNSNQPNGWNTRMVKNFTK